MCPSSDPARYVLVELVGVKFLEKSALELLNAREFTNYSPVSTSQLSVGDLWNNNDANRIILYMPSMRKAHSIADDFGYSLCIEMNESRCKWKPLTLRV